MTIYKVVKNKNGTTRVVFDEKNGNNVRSDLTVKKSKRESVQISLHKDIIHAFTDGSCIGNPGPGGSGVVLIYNGVIREYRQSIGYSTSNTAELNAIRLALTRIQYRDVPVVIYTDSLYCVGVLIWKWKVSKNRHIIKEIKELIKEFSYVKIVKIQGHSGIKYNVAADRLAGLASREIFDENFDPEDGEIFKGDEKICFEERCLIRPSKPRSKWE